MKQLLFLFITTLTFAQVDSMRITFTQATDVDLYGTILYGDTIALPTTVIDTVLAGTEFLEWKPSYAGLWRIRAKSLDDSSNTSAYSSVDTVTIWRDSIPSQFTFHDSIDAAVSSQIASGGVALSGFDSAQVTVTGGDYRLSALGTWTRSPSFASTGDTLFAVDTSSASNLTKTDVRIAIAGIVDTFSVTTVAASGGHITDSLKRYWDYTDLTNGAVTAGSTNDWVDQIESIEYTTVQATITKTDTGVVYGAEAVLRLEPNTLNADSSLTVEVVLQLPSGADSTTAMGVIVVLDTSSIRGNKRLNIGWNAGTFNVLMVSWGTATWFSVRNTLPLLGKMSHIVIAWDGLDQARVWFNNVVQTDVANNGAGDTGDKIEVGGLEGNLPENSTLKLIRIYEDYFDNTKTDTNYDAVASELD